MPLQDLIDALRRPRRGIGLPHAVREAACALACAWCAVDWADLFGANWPLRHSWLFDAPKTVAWEVMGLNALFGLTVYALARVVLAPAAAAVLGVALLGAVAAISHRKMLELDLPLLPWDLWFVADVGDLLAFVGLPSGGIAALVAGAAIALSALAWRARRSLVRPLRGVPVAALVAAALVAACAWGVVLPSSPRGLSGQIHNITWDQGANFTNFGPYYTFGVNLPFIRIREPAASHLAAADALDRMSAPPPAVGAAHDRPDVVLVLSESFTRLPEQIFARPFTCLAAAPASRLVTPSWGGMTANVEFELLSGYPHAVMPPGSIPFQMYLSRPVASALPQQFRRQGWRTGAVHTYRRDFFSRPRAFAALGIDEYAGLEDMQQVSLRGRYVDDRVLFRELLRRLDAPAGGPPRFLHAVSMMAHLPYGTPDRFPVDAELAARLPAALEEDRLPLTQYASMIYDHERAFCDFLDQVRKRPRRTLVLFYGDHYPSFGTTAVYRRIEQTLRGDGSTLDLARDYSKPPLVLFDSRRGFVPLPPEVAAYNLGTLLLREAGLAPQGHWAMPHKLDNVTLVHRVFASDHQSSRTLAQTAGRPPPELQALYAHAWRHLFAPAP